MRAAGGHGSVWPELEVGESEDGDVGMAEGHCDDATGTLWRRAAGSHGCRLLPGAVELIVAAAAITPACESRRWGWCCGVVGRKEGRLEGGDVTSHPNGGVQAA